MTQIPAFKRGRLASLQILPEPTPQAEVLVGPHHLGVTLALTRLEPDDLDLLVTKHSLRLRSRKDPEGLSYLIPLPMSVDPGRYVLHYANGVYDLTLERASL